MLCSKLLLIPGFFWRWFPSCLFWDVSGIQHRRETTAMLWRARGTNHVTNLQLVLKRSWFWCPPPILWLFSRFSSWQLWFSDFHSKKMQLCVPIFFLVVPIRSWSFLGFSRSLVGLFDILNTVYGVFPIVSLKAGTTRISSMESTFCEKAPVCLHSEERRGCVQRWSSTQSLSLWTLEEGSTGCLSVFGEGSWSSLNPSQSSVHHSTSSLL